MEVCNIKPLLAHVANLLVAKLLFQTEEYQKENLTEESYIFAPHHTNNFDGYLIWSLLSKDYDLDTFMYKEFWDHYPAVAKLLPLFNVFPITRNKVQMQELKTEQKKLERPDHSLVIFPQGRHVDPKVITNFKEYHKKTIPLGAFYLAAFSNKPIMPIYMEPQLFFRKNAVVYGKPLYPEEFKIITSRKRINKENLVKFANAWVDEIHEAYLKAIEYVNREMHPYVLQTYYTDASGENYGGLIDPNRIMEYLDAVELLKKLENINFDTLESLAEQTKLSLETLKIIAEIDSVYKKSLVRR